MVQRTGLFLCVLISFMVLGCKISGTVSLDNTGLKGVTVVLSGDADMMTSTDSEGNYVFNSVNAGSYKVTITPPSGYTRSISRKVVKEKKNTSVDGVNFAMASDTIRSIETGQVIGFKEGNGSHAWLGVPYGKADRWKAPEQGDDWGDDTYVALELGPVCTQYAGMFVDGSEADEDGIVGCEDCLYLNLWAPEDALSAPEPLPVMVWIHGGGNSIGHGGNVNGQVLAETYDLIVVSFNYRLGPFGWFTHPALETGNKLDDSGNYGTLDVNRVLQWVQDNIAEFGGDPSNVTLFGQSAGGLDTCNAMLSKGAAGKFHKAIIQSGGMETTDTYVGQNYTEDGGHDFSSREIINNLLIAEDNDIDTRNAARLHQENMDAQEIAAYLNSKSNHEILAAYEMGFSGMFSFPESFRDGVVLPEGDPLELITNTDNYTAVPVMIGSTRDEQKLFMILDPDFTISVGDYPVRARDDVYYELYSRYHSDALKARGVDSLATILSDTPGQPGVFAYRFDWDDEPTIAGADMSFLLGAAHGVEIAFAFDDFNHFIVPEYSPLVFNNANLPGSVALAGSMSSYWAEFARNGSPGTGVDGTEINWTAWDNDSSADKFIIFDTEEDGGIRMNNSIITAEMIKSRLITDATFPDQETHCQMYEDLFKDTPLWDDAEYANLGAEGCGSCIDDISPADLRNYFCDGIKYTVSIPEGCENGGCGLIFDVHGYTMSAEIENNCTNLRALGRDAVSRGAETPYIVVQPNANGIPSSWSETDDAKLFSFMELAIEAFNVDTARVHFNGFSQGGFMTHRFICKYSDVIASFAPIAGANDSSHIIQNWQCTSVSPILEIGNPLDSASFGMERIRDKYIAQMDPINYMEEELPSGDGYTLTKYTDGIYEFQLLSHHFMGLPFTHCIPGGTGIYHCNTKGQLEIGETIIDFYIAHPKGSR